MVALIFVGSSHPPLGHAGSTHARTCTPLLHRPCMYACISCISHARQVEQSSHRMHCVYALHTSHHACISPRWQDADVASHARSRHRQRHVACRCACSQAIMHRKRLTQHCFACNAGTPGSASSVRRCMHRMPACIIGNVRVARKYAGSAAGIAAWALHHA